MTCLKGGELPACVYADIPACPHADLAFSGFVILTHCLHPAVLIITSQTLALSLPPYYLSCFTSSSFSTLLFSLFDDSHGRNHAQSPQAPSLCLNRNRDTQSPAPPTQAVRCKSTEILNCIPSLLTGRAAREAGKSLTLCCCKAVLTKSISVLSPLFSSKTQNTASFESPLSKKINSITAKTMIHPYTSHAALLSCMHRRIVVPKPPSLLTQGEVSIKFCKSWLKSTRSTTTQKNVFVFSSPNNNPAQVAELAAASDGVLGIQSQSPDKRHSAPWRTWELYISPATLPSHQISWWIDTNIHTWTWSSCDSRIKQLVTAALSSTDTTLSRGSGLKQIQTLDLSSPQLPMVGHTKNTSHFPHLGA